MKSIWTKTAEIPTRNPLPGSRKTEVVVIGGGMAGILIAYYLQKQGKSVVVLEADRIGSGQTGYTTAKITAQHNLIYRKLEKALGKEYARQYAAVNQMAVEEYKKLIARHSINCHLEEKDAYLYSVSESEVLRREADCAMHLGLPASFVRDIELPFTVFGAVKLSGQAQFHPLEFLRDISVGLTIFERTKVKEVRGHQVITDRGSVYADKIVFACHYPFINLPGFYFMKMYQERSYVLELGPVVSFDGMYLGIDKKSFSFRSEGDRLLMGYGSHRTGKKQPDNPYRVMKQVGSHLYPGAKETGRWSAQDCMTMDGVPYIGTYSAAMPDWYVATGFGKWGMTTSMVAAKILSAQIAGRRTPYDDLFSPQRLRLMASGSFLLTHGLESARGLMQGAMPGVVKCPHLGCRMKWNPVEKTWDCPCHGSRFEQNGKILNGPAQENIPFID